MNPISVKNERVNGAFNILFFYFTITLSIFQQMPIVNELFYSQVRFVLYISFMLYGGYTILNSHRFLRSNLIRLFILTFFFSIMLSLLSGINVFVDLLIPLGILICSINTKFDLKSKRNICTIYVITVSILAISTIFYYGEGFVVSQMYNIPSKNQIGPMIAITSLISFLAIVDRAFLGIKRKYMPLFLITLFINIACLAAIRNRAGLLSFFVCVFLYFILNRKVYLTIKKLLAIHISICLIFFILLSGIISPVINYLWDSFTLNYDITNIDSFSAGRSDTYIDALNFAFNHPFLGSIGSTVTFRGVPHNYLIYNIAYFGVLLSLPLILFYLYLWIFTIKGIRNNINNNLYQPVNWIVLLALIVSIFEYTYPFGPGTSQLMTWFLVGQSLINEKDI